MDGRAAVSESVVCLRTIRLLKTRDYMSKTPVDGAAFWIRRIDTERETESAEEAEGGSGLSRIGRPRGTEYFMFERASQGDRESERE